MALEQIKRVIIENYGYLKDRLGDEILSDPNCFSIPIEALDVRFEDLKVEFSSIFDNSTQDYKYNGLNNTLIINKKYSLREDLNLSNFFMDIVLNIAYYNPVLKYSGFGNETYEALNKGFREMITLSIIEDGRSKEHFESDEYIYANLFSRMIGIEPLWSAFAKNDPNYINNALREKSIEYSELFGNLNAEANRNNKFRISKKGISTLDKIESDLIKMFLLDNPSKDELEIFLTNMVSEPTIFKDSQKYERLTSLDLDAIYNNYVQSLNTEKTY